MICNSKSRGFTLLEVLIGITVLALITLVLFSLFNFTLKVAFENKARATAAALAIEKLELARNLPYNQVGTIGGIPSGPIAALENVTRNNIQFTVKIDIIYIDDPFDGTQDGVPNDLLPTDYKKMRVAVSWPFRLTTKPVSHVATITPKGLETNVGGGTLDLTVFDAAGLPVPQADVTIINNAVTPAININTQSTDSGKVLLPGTPTSTQAYEITATKAGFSTDRTYGVDPINLPTPLKSHLTVFEGQRTEASFQIDLVSSLTVKTVNAEDSFCEVALLNDQGLSPLAKSQLPSQQPAVFRIASSHALFADDFSVADDLAGWTETGEGFTEAGGVARESPNGNNSTGTAYAGIGSGWTDYTYSVRIRSGDDDLAGLRFRYGSSNNFYYLQQHYGDSDSHGYVSGSQLELGKVVNGTVTKLDQIADNVGSAPGNVTESSSRFYAFKVVLSGTNIKVYIDDTLRFDVNDTAQPSGGIAIESVNNKDIDFDDVLVIATASTNSSPTITAVTDSPDPVSAGAEINFSIDWADADIGELIKVHVCKSDSLTNQVCDAGAWWAKSAVFTAADPEMVSYTTQAADVGMQDYYAFVCDDEAACSNSSSGTFTVNAATPTGPKDIYVAGDAGSDTTGDGSLTKPYQSISRGVQDIADNDGDTVHVKGSLTYSAQVNLTPPRSGSVGTPTTIQAWAGTGQPTISGSSYGFHISNTEWLVIKDFKIINTTGAGVLAEAAAHNVTLQNLKITLSSGRGILVRGSSVNPVIENSLIYETGSDGIKIEAGSNSPRLLSNTIDSSGGAGINLDSLEAPYLRNNIVSFNALVGIQGTSLTNVDTDYNIYFGNSTSTAGFTYGPNRILADPLYVDALNDNYYLQSLTGFYPFGPSDTALQHSPGVDTADPASSYSAEPLPNGCRANIGAFGNTPQASKSLSLADPIPNVDFSLRGAKLIGYDASDQAVPKYHASSSTDTVGQVTINNLEWDSYTITLSGPQTGYDIAYIDPPQPINLLPNTAPGVEIGLVPDAEHTLLITVLDADNQPISGTDVQVVNAALAYDQTIITMTHGQSFFTPLSQASYLVTVTAPGEVPVNFDIAVAGYTTQIVTIGTGSPAPPQPPAAPTITGLTNVAETSLTINWTDNASDELGYRIYRNTSATKPLNPSATLAPNSTTYVDANLTCNTTYYYWVEVYNANGLSDASASQVTSACTSPPAAPTITGLTNVTETTITVNWDDNAVDEDGYRVYRNTVNTNPGSPLATLDADTESYADSGLTCDATYYYWVEAYNANGAAEDSASQETVACGPILVFQDFFTEGSDTELSQHPPNLGTAWTQIISIKKGKISPGQTLEADGSDYLDDDECGKSDGALYQITNSIPSPDYEVSVFQRNGDTNDDMNILAARIQDANNMYAFRWNERGARLYKRTAGSWIQLGSQVGGLADGSTVTLKVQGTTISALDDGITLVSVVDSDHAAAGSAGVGMGAVIINGEDCSSQKLDNFEINVTN